MAAFEELGVMPEIIRAVEDLEWQLPRDIQAEAIPLILGGGDVMAAAETGSGKTGAFALPLVQIVHETLRGVAVVSSASSKAASSSACQLSVDDRDAQFAISADGLVCQARTENWAGARATVGVLKGKYYYEAIVEDEGLCRVGWATKAAKLDLGTDRNGFGFGGTGKKSHNRQFDSYGEAFGLNDVIGCYLDLEAGTVGFSKNGVWFGDAFSIPDALVKFAFYPAVVLKNAQMRFNFGATPFKHPPGHGYKGIHGAPPTDTTLTAGHASKQGRGPLAVVLEPSRDLAQQTHEAIVSFGKHLPPPRIDVELLVGGVAPGPQVKAIERGVDIVVATPGRIQDLVETGKLDVSSVRFYVLDEADALIESSEEIVMNIYKQLPKSKTLQILMFSATLHSPKIRDLGEKICRFPTWVDLKGKDAVPETVDHTFVAANPRENRDWTKAQPRIQTDGIHFRDNIAVGANTPEMHSEAIKVLKPILLMKIINSFKMDQAMIFCRTKLDCDNLEAYLNGLSGRKGPMIDTEYSCCVVHADRQQFERTANIQKFKEGSVRFLICTDVAARGIDIKELPYVINYTLPDKVEDYLHRTGRVGRAERMGLAISIVGSMKEKVWYHSCPSRGKSCNNTALKEQGGCAIWYDEPDYWAQIQRRLGMEVPPLDKDFRLPSHMQDGATVYGQKRESSDVAVFQGHQQQIKPLVVELAEMEDRAQKSFWTLKQRFSRVK